MAGPYYVDSNAGGSATGADWTNAFLTLGAALAVDAAGDTIYVAHNHSESTAGAVTYTHNGTIGSPVRILCVNTGTGALSTGAVIATTGANSISLLGNSSFFYYYGIEFQAGDSTNSATIAIANSFNGACMEQCTFYLRGNNTSGRLRFNGLGGSPSDVVLKDCTYRFSHAGQRLQGNSCFVRILGGAVYNGTAPSYLIDNGNYYWSTFEILGVDFQYISTSTYISQVSNAGGLTVYMADCQFPSGWTGPPEYLPESYPGHRTELVNCDGGSTNYKVWISDPYGSVVQDTSVYLDSGVTDGTTSLSYKFSGTTSCNKHNGRFYGPAFNIWNETTGSSVTATVEIVHDGASALNDNEIWLEVMYLGASGVPLGTWTSDGVDVIASGSAQASSSATWTGDTGTGPNGSSTWHQLKLSCTFTPQKKGVVVARVVLAKASTSVYVDPNVTLS